MDKHNLVLGLVELRGVYVTPSTLWHLNRYSQVYRCSIGELLGKMIDKAHMRQGADNFCWGGIDQAKIDQAKADQIKAAEIEAKKKKQG